jgi:hypothetical protein
MLAAAAVKGHLSATIGPRMGRNLVVSRDGAHDHPQRDRAGRLGIAAGARLVGC